MKVSEVVSTMNDGVKASHLAKNIGIGEKKLRAALHKLGFTYSQSTRQWSFTGEGDNPQDTNILDVVSYKHERRVNSTSRVNSSKREQKVTSDSHTDEIKAPNVSPPYELKFTRDQFDALCAMANERLNQSSKQQTTREAIYLRIMSLNTKDRVRKTIVFDKSVAAKFDSFAEKTKLNKSDILAVALSDFLDAYDVE